MEAVAFTAWRGTAGLKDLCFSGQSMRPSIRGAMGSRKVNFGFKAASANMKRELGLRSASVHDLTGMRRLMALLDEWSAPEVSRYFDVRLKTRLRAEGLLVFNTDTGAGVWNC